MPAEGTARRDEGEEGERRAEERDSAQGARGDVVQWRTGPRWLGREDEQAAAAEQRQEREAQARPGASHAAAGASQCATGAAADRAVVVVSTMKKKIDIIYM